MNTTFAITKLHVLEHEDWNPNILKVLKQGETYFFNQYGEKSNIVPDNFFAVNLTISTIVGKNGSGKSSLVELLYRMINNLGFALLKCGKTKKNTANILYVPHIYADLYYIVERKDETKKYVLHCYGDRVFVDASDIRHCFEQETMASHTFHDRGHLFTIWHWNESAESLSKLSSILFYTIGINYSMHSLISEDYNDETLEYNHNQHDGLETWLDGVFHKNDGYRTPITLNPYRHHGQVDMSNINSLVSDYLVSILSFNQRRKRFNEFLPGYRTNEIRYTTDFDAFVRKCMLLSGYKEDNTKDFIAQWWYNTISPVSYMSTILDSFGFDVAGLQVPKYHILPYLYLYLVYKVINIAQTYGEYSDFSGLAVYEMLLAQKQIEALFETQMIWAELVDRILNDQSHITYKIRQTCRLIACLNSIGDDEDISWLWDAKGFTLEQYNDFTERKWRKVPKRIRSKYERIPENVLDVIKDTLPPPIFQVKVELERIADGTCVPLSKLSTGERQYLHTMATIVYHINNLRSVRSRSRMRYRRINIVLDEAEICFHPEMQRCFVNKLVSYLSGTGLTRYLSFHILIVTHSPFILSDIPQSNILYMGCDGRPDKTEKVKPFGANVNDILSQSFFLHDGFTGDFAKKKIIRAFEWLHNPFKENEEIKSEEVKLLFGELIGEPLLVRLMRQLYNEKDSNQ